MRGVVLILTVVLWTAQDAAAVSEAERKGAIQRLQAHLLEQQDPLTGAWEESYHPGNHLYGGETALVTYALLRTGLSAQDPRIVKAIDFLRNVTMSGTYAVSLRAHCWATLSEDYRGELASDARWLLQAQVDGLFNYTPRTGPRHDPSVTQYGLLGLWESAKRNGPTAAGVWRRASQHFVQTQNPDGGWAYTDRGGSTPAMTAAGLTALLIAQENLYRARQKPPVQLAQAINGGIAWLEEYTTKNGVTVGDDPYYLVSLERAALACGIRTLGGRDWFHAGARSILDQERGRGTLGNDVVDDAFALMFLARGGVPVWINKLQLQSRVWNSRPNDLNMLTRQLSDRVEAELGWQVIDARSDISFWLRAPVAYVASDESLYLSAAELSNLKTYLDLGGTLVATPEGNAEAFVESIREIAARTHPGYAFERAGEDHPLMGLVHEVELPEAKRPWVLSNGVRDLIVLAPTDWGMALQSRRGDLDTSADEIMANLHALVTERGRDATGFAANFVPREDGPSRGMVTVVRAIQEDQAPLEPLAWLPLANRFFNETGREVELHLTPIDRAEDFGAHLVYLGGADERRLSAPQLRHVIGFIHRGGTVLIETIGGRGRHTEVLVKQLESVLGDRAVPIDPAHPIITGEGLSRAGAEGGFDIRRVSYRRFSTLNRGPVDSPRLLSIKVDGRDAVIASHEDLSLGVLGARRWGVDGYDVGSARGLLANILLYAADTRLGYQATPVGDEPPPEPKEAEVEILDEP
jgi:hypothetical protein